MIQGPSYIFFWQGDLHVGVPVQDEKSKLVVTAEEGINIEVLPMIVENGRAVIPVKFRSSVKGHFSKQIKFEFVEE